MTLITWNTGSPIHGWLLSLLVWSVKREQGARARETGRPIRIYPLTSAEVMTLAILSGKNRGPS